MSLTLARQLFVAGSPQLAAVSIGGAFTYPSILLQQFAANDSSIVLDFETASWIGSIHGLAGIPSIFMPAIMQWQGRKFAFTIACLISIIGWIVAFTATSTVAILISESCHGLGNNSMLAVSLLSISEMVAPKIRNVSMASYPLMQGFGMTMCGILGRYLHWKTVSAIMFFPVSIAMLMACAWPESPSWLAYKGKFKECEQAFIWLRGEDELAKKEMQELINAQKERSVINRRMNNSITYKLRSLMNKNFYMPCFHMFVFLCLSYGSGSAVVLVYTVKVIQSATRNENAAYYGSIFVNTVMFVCLCISAVLLRRFSNKSILLLSVIGVGTSLSCASLSLYLQTVDILSKESIVGLCFLVIFVMCIGVGFAPIGLTMAVELIPVKYRGEGGALFVIFICLLHSVSLKIAPYLFLYISFWGTILIYAVNSTICGLYIWKCIPETKDRTLQELEDYYTNGHFEMRRVSDNLSENLTPQNINKLIE